MINKKIYIGIITSPHGIKGEVNVKTFLDNPEDLGKFSHIFDVNGDETFEILDIRGIKGDMVIAKIKGYDNRNQAEEIRSKKLYIDKSELPDTKEDEFYQKDILGLKVFENKKEIGKVSNVYNYGAGEMIEIELKNKQIEAIPFNDDYVKNIDLNKGNIEITLPEYIE
jgi:16S rRNA processing protein RimM